LNNYTNTTGNTTNKFNLSTTTVTKIANPYFFINSNSSGYTGSDFMTWQLVQSLTPGTSTNGINIMFVPNNYSVLISGTFVGQDSSTPGNNSLFIFFQNAGFATNGTFSSGRYARAVTPTVSAVNYTGAALGATTCALSITSQQIIATINSGTTFGCGIVGKWTFTCTAFSTTS
jgi:hypothetical protein